jgi:hypothetical protein
LHQVHPDEVVEAQGEFQYLRGGQPTGQMEHWMITRLPNGSQVVRAEIDGSGMTPSGPNLLTHLHRNAERKDHWLRLQYTKGDFCAAAQYNFEPAQVVIFRQMAGESRRQNMVEIADSYVVDYHPVIAHDYVWRGYPARAQGSAISIPVFSPDLWASDEAVLDGRALRFTITPLAPEPLEVPAGKFQALRYKVILSDGVLAMGWFDEAGIPLRWWYPEKGYDFILTRYHRSASTPGA